MNTEKILKHYRRTFVEEHLLVATLQPGLVGLWMQEAGWYSPNVKFSDIEHHVVKLVQRIDEEGRICNGREVVMVNGYLKHQVRTVPWEKPEGFGIVSYVRPRNADASWSKEETCCMFEVLFNHTVGGKRMRVERTAKEMWRTGKAIQRQFELFLYNEQSRYAVEYFPTTVRTDRTGKDLMVFEIEMIKRHARDGVPSVVTARLLMRGLSDFLCEQKYVLST